MMRHLIPMVIISTWLVGTSYGRVEIFSVHAWYRQMAMDLHDLAVEQGKPIPAHIREWPLVKEATSRPGESATYLKQITNGLATVPYFLVITCFEEGRWREFQGSHLISISRRTVYEMHRDDKSGGRYVFLHEPDPPQIWALWLDKKDAQLILSNIGNFATTSQPLAFPEVGEPIYNANGTWPRGWLVAIVAVFLTVLFVFGLCANTQARRPV